MANIINTITLKHQEELFKKCLSDELAEEFLETLLNLMKLAFIVDKDFQRNIDNFKGTYQFRSEDNSVAIYAGFENGVLNVEEKLYNDNEVDVTIIFKDGKALMHYLTSKEQDVLRAILNNEIRVNGNWNYLYKFGFMAKHLQLSLSGGLPV